MTKTCSSCSMELQLMEFHVARLGAMGRAAMCKRCRSEQARCRYISVREVILEKCRSYRARNAETLRVKESEKRRRPETQARLAADLRRRRRTEPEKIRARRAVATALHQGHLVKPAACESCGRGDVPRLVAHHHQGYAREHWLEVEWLCDSCHQRHHAEERVA